MEQNAVGGWEGPEDVLVLHDTLLVPVLLYGSDCYVMEGEGDI